MFRIGLALVVVTAFETTSVADRYTTGVALGGSATTLGGDVDRDWTPGVGLAVLFGFDPGGSWAVGVQPGWRQTGSREFQVDCLALPVVGDLRFQRGRWRLRASAGIAPEWVTDVTARGHEQGHDVTDEARRWNVAVLGAIAAEWEQPERKVRWAFLELRFGRALFSLEPDDINGRAEDLDVHAEEVGLWFGLRSP